MVELKFRRLACSLDTKHCAFKVKTEPLMFRKVNGKEYLIVGNSRTCSKQDKKVASILFGKEVIYIDNEVLVPRDFFFI